MIKLSYRNSDSAVIGYENGLNIQEEFFHYKDKITEIITSLNQRKDKPGQWLQWMNLGYNEETVEALYESYLEEGTMIKGEVTLEKLMMAVDPDWAWEDFWENTNA